MTSLAHLLGMLYDLQAEVDRQKVPRQCVPVEIVVKSSHPVSELEDEAIESSLKQVAAGESASSSDTFEISINIGSFNGEEIVVTVRNHEIKVNGEHEERADDFGFISRHFTRKYILPDEYKPSTISALLTDDGKLTIKAMRRMTKTTDIEEMDEMILHCNQNTVYVLNTNYTNYGEFDMIGLFGTQTAGYHRTTSPSTATFQTKSKATSMLLDNQIKDRLKEVNNNLIKKRPHFLKFFHDNFFKANSIDIDSHASPQNSYKSTQVTNATKKSSQKSSKELYREAAQILGITCEFDESCRCIECQSRYFDCDCDDDESDTLSNLSALIDGEEEFSSHVDNEGFYCNGTKENCNFNGYVIGGECDNNNESDNIDAVAVEE